MRAVLANEIDVFVWSTNRIRSDPIRSNVIPTDTSCLFQIPKKKCVCVSQKEKNEKNYIRCANSKLSHTHIYMMSISLNAIVVVFLHLNPCDYVTQAFVSVAILSFMRQHLVDSHCEYAFYCTLHKMMRIHIQIQMEMRMRLLLIVIASKSESNKRLSSCKPLVFSWHRIIIYLEYASSPIEENQSSL